MRLRPWLVVLHFSLWTGLFLAFLVFGAPLAGKAALQNRLGPIDPAHSVDNYLKGLLGIKNGSQLLSEAFASLPPNKKLVVVINSKSSPSDFLGMLSCYLAWPREVQVIKIDRGTAPSDMFETNSSSVGGFVFPFVQPPPVQARQIRLGAGLILIPGNEMDLTR